MSAGAVLGFISVFGAGLLAGEEFVIRYGVRGPLSRLVQEPHIRMRRGSSAPCASWSRRSLAPTLLSAVAVTVVDGADRGLAFRCAGHSPSLAWVAVDAPGHVPINEAALDWDPARPSG